MDCCRGNFWQGGLPASRRTRVTSSKGHRADEPGSPLSATAAYCLGVDAAGAGEGAGADGAGPQISAAAAMAPFWRTRSSKPADMLLAARDRKGKSASNCFLPSRNRISHRSTVTEAAGGVGVRNCANASRRDLRSSARSARCAAACSNCRTRAARWRSRAIRRRRSRAMP